MIPMEQYVKPITLFWLYVCVYIYIYGQRMSEGDEIWGLYFYWLLRRINYTARARLNYCKCLYERHHLIINSLLQIKGTDAKMA